MQMTICELFAGVGGFRLGFERDSTEWKTVWFNQWEPSSKKQDAHKCYVSHFGDINEFTNVDISNVDKTTIPDHTLLVGGFPCQDYSVAKPSNQASGIEGKKGVLWWQIVDVIKTKHPRMILLENVDRLLKSPAKQRGRDFGIILKCLYDNGYNAEWRVINAADYGCAQRRRRTFIFAYLHERYEHLAIFNKAFPITDDELKYSTISLNNQSIFDVSNTFSFDFKNYGYMVDGIISTSQVNPIKEHSITIRDIIDTAPDEKSYQGNFDGIAYLKSAKKIPRKTSDGHAYIFSEGAVPFPDSLDMPARTMLTSEATTNRSTHVICDPVTNNNRLLTPLECERINGFDDNWTNTGMSRRMRYFCMGNALVVPLITRMAKEIRKSIE